VAVEKVRIPPKQPKFGGYKMSKKLKRSFVEHPSAILFLRISSEGVFQQPRDLSTVIENGQRQRVPSRKPNSQEHQWEQWSDLAPNAAA
jgi:hypothetical protein